MFAPQKTMYKKQEIYCCVDMRVDVSQILTMAVPGEMMREEGDG
jgi:hypothetical protein